MHIPEREKCNWIREQIETIDPVSVAACVVYVPPAVLALFWLLLCAMPSWTRSPSSFGLRPMYTKKEKLNILDRLAWSEMFETFLAKKYTAAKRFGLEGAESLIPGMKALIDTGADLGVENVVIGMPHRGRLNVLANVVRKPMSQIFSEFSGAPQPVGIRAWCKIPLHSGCDSHAESAALERRMRLNAQAFKHLLLESAPAACQRWPPVHGKWGREVPPRDQLPQAHCKWEARVLVPDG
eukprot:787290-Pelagomonas_calceolata.AAC.4